VLIDFFYTLKDAKVPVSIKEFLFLLEALEKDIVALLDEPVAVRAAAKN